jgi:flagellar hook-length control protein FliK
LLAPADADDPAALGATPFALCLELLTAPPPSGEGLPSAGNELPAPPFDAAGAAVPTPSAAELMAALGPAAAAVQAQLRPAEPSGEALLASAPATVGAAAATTQVVAPQVLAAAVPPEPLPATAAQSLALPEPAPAIAPAALEAQAPAGLDPIAPFDPAAAPSAAARHETGDVLLQRDATLRPAAVAPTFDGSPLDDRRFERVVAPRLEAGSHSAAAQPQPTAAPQYQAAAVAATTATAEVGAVAQSAARRAELQKAAPLLSVSTDAGALAPSDWLPAAGATGSTSQTVAATTQAASGAPVDTRSPAWHEAFASRVQWLVDHDVGEAHIKLNPPELGAVDVKISLVDDKTFVQLTAATAAARDELQHSLPRLRELFTASGLELGGASVQNGRDGQQAEYGQGQPGRGQAPEAARAPAFFAAADELALPPPRPSPGRIDVFA